MSKLTLIYDEMSRETITLNFQESQMLTAIVLQAFDNLEQTYKNNKNDTNFKKEDTLSQLIVLYSICRKLGYEMNDDDELT